MPAAALAVIAPATPTSAAGSVLFGAYAGIDASGSRLNALNRLEAELGRELDLVRVFERWDSGFGGPFHRAVEAGDAVMLLSVKAKRENGSTVSGATSPTPHRAPSCTTR